MRAYRLRTVHNLDKSTLSELCSFLVAIPLRDYLSVLEVSAIDRPRNQLSRTELERRLPSVLLRLKRRTIFHSVASVYTQVTAMAAYITHLLRAGGGPEMGDWANIFRMARRLKRI